MIYMYFRHKLEEETRAGGGGGGHLFIGLCEVFFPKTIYQRKDNREKKKKVRSEKDIYLPSGNFEKEEGGGGGGGAR